jgi:hypothetical protein
MAVSGHNGDNESFIGFSSSISLSFYDENLNEIEVISNSPTPIDITILRDSSLKNTQYQYVNASQIKISNDSLFLQNGFYIKQINASVHIELKPLSLNVSYLIVMKLGSTPIVNSTYSNHDFLKLICPCTKFLVLILNN